MMNRKALALGFTVLTIGIAPLGWWSRHNVVKAEQGQKTTMKLPSPRHASGISVEEALTRRRSLREFTGAAISSAQLGQLLWAAQGKTGGAGFRTAPSAGALYPLETYVVVGLVDGLVPAVYRYQAASHKLMLMVEGDKRRQLAAAALRQMWMADAAAVIVLSAVYERTTRKYGPRGVRYVDMEAGHAGQNAALQAVALDLGLTTVGAFDDEAVKTVLGMEGQEKPLYLLPVGR